MQLTLISTISTLSNKSSIPCKAYQSTIWSQITYRYRPTCLFSKCSSAAALNMRKSKAIKYLDPSFSATGLSLSLSLSLSHALSDTRCHPRQTEAHSFSSSIHIETLSLVHSNLSQIYFGQRI